MTVPQLRLGVNIDHVATVRNARGGAYPDPVRAAHLAVEAGQMESPPTYGGSPPHPRRRHRSPEGEPYRAAQFRDGGDGRDDCARGCDPAARLMPRAGEARGERTTEGGLDIIGGRDHLAPRIRTLAEAGIRVSLFVEPEPEVMEAAHALGAPVVELHTRQLLRSGGRRRSRRCRARTRADPPGGGSWRRARAGDPCGPGSSTRPTASARSRPFREIRELNIGHALIADAIFVGLAQAIRDMRAAMDRARG